MLQIFRRIRKTLFKTGKLRQYLAYAIGEIILVVIGILLAVQINTWNNHRKERALEHVYYQKLLEDVRQDSATVKKEIFESDQRIQHANTLLALLQQPTPDNAEVMAAILGAISKTTYAFKPSKAAFDDIKSSGNLPIITDLKLKNQLINYYAIVDGYTDVLDVNSDAAVNIFYNPADDLAALGWQYLDYVKKEIDTTRVDFDKIYSGTFPTEEVRKKLTSDAIAYLTTSARKKFLYNEMYAEVDKMRLALLQKCTSD